MLNSKIIILNSPPYTGKDTISDILAYMYSMEHVRFKEHLYEVAADFFGMYVNTFKGLASNRDTKEVPHSGLRITFFEFHALREYLGFTPKYNKLDQYSLCISPRSALIYVSELIVKPREGKAYFGEYLANTFESGCNYVASDGGFKEEVGAVYDKVGQDNILVVEFTRGGRTFAEDSRGYLSEQMDIKHLLKTDNDGTLDEIVERIMIEFNKMED